MTKAVQVMIDCIVVVGVLRCCALLHSVCDLKLAQMNEHCNLIQELILYKGHNLSETTKNICCMKSEGTVDNSTVTRWFKKFYLSCKNVNNQARSKRSKTVNSKTVLQVIEVNPVTITQRESSISQSSVISHFHVLGKNICRCHVTKILKNF